MLRHDPPRGLTQGFVGSTQMWNHIGRFDFAARHLIEGDKRGGNCLRRFTKETNAGGCWVCELDERIDDRMLQDSIIGFSGDGDQSRYCLPVAYSPKCFGGEPAIR